MKNRSWHCIIPDKEVNNKWDEVGIITDDRPDVPNGYTYCKYCDTWYSDKRYEFCPTCDLVDEMTKMIYGCAV